MSGSLPSSRGAGRNVDDQGFGFAGIFPCFAEAQRIFFRGFAPAVRGAGRLSMDQGTPDDLKAM
jgi:hypothetical protein